MNKFYTYFGSGWNEVLVSGYENGVKFNKKIPYKPYLFVPGNGDYKTIHDKNLERIDFDSIQEARDFIKRYSEVSNFTIFGMTNFPYVYIYDEYKEQQPDTSLIRIGNVDIETDSENGFGNAQLADREIISITLKVFKDKVFYVLGRKPYETKDPELLKLLEQGYKIDYCQCSSEKELLLMFLSLWRELQLDIITGWNIELFDIPYIIKRIMLVLTEEHAKSLSPFKMLNKKVVNMFGNDNDQYEIVGIPIVDGMALYKKFAFVNQESYSLAYISSKTLGVSKLDYSEYKTLARLYKENHNKFIDYNIIDVHRVEQIDNYTGYMDLLFTICYLALVNFVDGFTTVRIWDVMIHNYLMDQKIAIPSAGSASKMQQIAGGHVKSPQIGKHTDVMSFDFTSLYPKLTMMCNISPDTIKGRFSPIIGEMSVEKILNGELKQYREDFIRENITISGRGNIFTKEKQGFIPLLMTRLFDQRKQFTNMEEEADALLAKINAEIHKRGLKV